MENENTKEDLYTCVGYERKSLYNEIISEAFKHTLRLTIVEIQVYYL